jgi:phosphatidylinositol alpha 1,6-mannosyltransferase
MLDMIPQKSSKKSAYKLFLQGLRYLGYPEVLLGLGIIRRRLGKIMVDQRLQQLFEARTTMQGDEVFGAYELISSQYPSNLAPVKRVAILTESFLPKVDGVSKTSYLTVRYLQETGRDVLIFGPDIAVPSIGPSEVVSIPSLAIPSATETRLALPIPYIAKRLQVFKPDLIHLASPALMTVSGMALGRELNIPVVANYQTDLPGYAAQYGFPIFTEPLRGWLRYLHNGCHINLVPSELVKNELKKYGFRRLRVWGRGVNIERFNPNHYSATMRERLLNGRDPDSLLVIFVGRLANEKRVDLLRDLADIPKVSLTIIGDGHMRDELEQLFAGTRTHFTGYMYKDELATAFASADAFFFAGSNETFGQVVQEAMASGLATVVTNQGAVGELVQEGKTGFVVEDNRRAFADAAHLLQNKRTLLREMSENARAVAETRPWSAIMSQLESYYHEALIMNQRFKSLFGHTFYHRPLSISARLQQLGILNDIAL